jgi:hypothetical protein
MGVAGGRNARADVAAIGSLVNPLVSPALIAFGMIVPMDTIETAKVFGAVVISSTIAIFVYCPLLIMAINSGVFVRLLISERLHLDTFLSAQSTRYLGKRPATRVIFYLLSLFLSLAFVAAFIVLALGITARGPLLFRAVAFVFASSEVLAFLSGLVTNYAQLIGIAAPPSIFFSSARALSIPRLLWGASRIRAPYEFLWQTAVKAGSILLIMLLVMITVGVLLRFLK